MAPTMSKNGAAAAAVAVTMLSGAGSLSFAQTGTTPAARVSRAHAASPAQTNREAQAQAGGVSTLAANSALAGISLVAASTARGRRSRLAQRAASGVAVAVGQQITWKGMAGQVQYVGPVDFAAGEWVGIALGEPHGLHDGNVFGKQYFQCQPKHGVFCPSADLAAMAAPPEATPAAPGAVAPAATAAAAPAGSISVGQRVGVLGTTGTVQYYGEVKFATGEWVGVQLDEPRGMHDGSVFGVSYFACPPKTGIFCQPSQLTLVGGAPAAPVAMPAPAAPVAMPAAPPAPVAAPTATFPLGTRVTWSGLEGVVKYCGDVKFATGEWVGIELDLNKGLYDGSVLGETYFSCDPMKGIFSEADRVTAA